MEYMALIVSFFAVLFKILEFAALICVIACCIKYLKSRRH